ncbi:hypothetical protein AXG93_3675s1000 [Marchantia polymorpha subsp. ruderalis]|uniref:Reverse transcriptase RNase H-like domain-containing protein n=1 Tax=Marchantia polymorpha subsp. ruderalis TaxID=1480154 RepID=A0A176VPQ9_MARPO|nr:hypothetical protein AXG93_3675s1000 [Marchantia polymorpha subsp. ruderalis]
MESDKLTGKLARWALILQEYDFQVVHRPGVANLDADGLSRNPCTSQEDDTGARWHGEVDEEMVPGWHASAFMCWLRGNSSREDHLTSYSSQRVDGRSPDPEVEDGGPAWCQAQWVPRSEIVFSNGPRGTDWRDHMFSECGRTVGYLGWPWDTV